MDLSDRPVSATRAQQVQPARDSKDLHPIIWDPVDRTCTIPCFSDFSGNQDGYYYAVSASSTDSTNYAYNAFDKNSNTYWNSAIGLYDASSGVYLGSNNMNITGSYPIDRISAVNTIPFFDETSVYVGQTQNYTNTFSQSSKNIVDDTKLMIYHTFDLYTVQDKIVLNRALESAITISSLINSPTIDTSNQLLGYGCIKFGSASVLRYVYLASLRFVTPAFTASFWIKQNVLDVPASGYQGLFSMDDQANNSFRLALNNSDPSNSYYRVSSRTTFRVSFTYRAVRRQSPTGLMWR